MKIYIHHQWMSLGAGVVSGAGQYSSMRKGTLGASSTRRCDTQLNCLVEY